MGFAQNVVPFSLATSFVVARILRNATAAEDVWSKYILSLIDIITFVRNSLGYFIQYFENVGIVTPPPTRQIFELLYPV